MSSASRVRRRCGSGAKAPCGRTSTSGVGRPPKLLGRGAEKQPVTVKPLALELPRRAFRTLAWRPRTKRPLRSRCAAVRVRAARCDDERDEPRPEQWLLIEWPSKEAQPTKYWLANLPEKTKRKDLLAPAKQRWIIERDYQELKQEVGRGHYEGRGWRGFHHHATLCIAAYGFLVAERALVFRRPGSGHCDYPHPQRRGSSARAGRPLRPERHNPASIATPRAQLAHYILHQLDRCPFCGSGFL